MKSILCGFLVICFSGVAAVAQTTQYDPAKAASYLDGRIEWWMGWKSAARDHETFCISCHTSGPYAVSRSALHGALAEKGPSPDETRVLDNITKRVRMWNEVAPFYPTTDKAPGKTPESRGTESILNALILSWNDRSSGKLSPDAKLALDNMWGEQLKEGDAKGAFGWLQFHNAPFEGDSQYYGAALAAVAVAYAPGDYQSSPAIKDNLYALESYLSKERASQKLIDQLVVLWASSRLPALLTDAQRKEIIAATIAKQQEDGGFSLSAFVGDWKRKDKTPLETRSDGYATGLATFAMEQAGVKTTDPALKKSLQWLRQNQDASEGRWAAWSLNKQRELDSDAGRFMSDAATAYAVMAIEAANSKN